MTPDPRFMSLALRLARRGIEGVSPNPMVGAVLVRNGTVIGQGWHRSFGGPHAEVEAIASARSARGADLYVTLEPCGHAGKTPPCSEAIARAGIRRVYFGTRDPNPLVDGRGLRLLRSRGIAAAPGPLEKECERLNAPFFHWVRTGTPWVILKWAMTLDGKTCTAGGESKWITGSEARASAHALRRRVDAIIVGTETALRDDPRLTPRPSRGRRPLRVVLDRRGKLPLRLAILGEAAGRDGPRLYVTTAAAGARRRRLLERRGLEVTILPAGREGFLLEPLLCELGLMGVSQLLVEGGASLAGSFLAAGHAHEAAAFIAPRLAGGEDAPGALGGRGIERLPRTPWLEDPEIRRLGRDILVQGRLRPSP
jgi:diaminohydroxyphosphoribosylaminopyrimidine deaminase/5-amino-6-(5-phosphoribosylamino)uracil reductase